jgi:hypothetical protein
MNKGKNENCEKDEIAINNKMPFMFENSAKGELLHKLFITSFLWCLLCMSIQSYYSGFSWDLVFDYIFMNMVFYQLMCFIFGSILYIFVVIIIPKNPFLENLKGDKLFNLLLLLYIVLIVIGCFIKMVSYLVPMKDCFLSDIYFYSIMLGSIGLVFFLLFYLIISSLFKLIGKIF